jgi:hypothetical protein
VIGHTEAAFLITSTVFSSITQTALCVCVWPIAAAAVGIMSCLLRA